MQWLMDILFSDILKYNRFVTTFLFNETLHITRPQHSPKHTLAEIYIIHVSSNDTFKKSPRIGAEGC